VQDPDDPFVLAKKRVVSPKPTLMPSREPTQLPPLILTARSLDEVQVQSTAREVIAPQRWPQLPSAPKDMRTVVPKLKHWLAIQKLDALLAVGPLMIGGWTGGAMPDASSSLLEPPQAASRTAIATATSFFIDPPKESLP
jgi:hypothetical protein